MPAAKKTAAKTPSHHFKFRVDLNVINHLGVGLYSSTPAALTELVANAWDADASTVTLAVDAKARSICIEDDGHGMSAHDVQFKFLNVGYSRRLKSSNQDFSDSKTRRVMGRKGIGKLSMFALADMIRVSSQARGSGAVGFVIDVPKFKDGLGRGGEPTSLKEFVPKPFKNGHGTRIELTRILTGLETTEAYLRVRLARRFSVIDDGRGFEVLLNSRNITKQDRGFYPHVQFLWTFDAATSAAVSALLPNIASVPSTPARNAKKVKCIASLDSTIVCDGLAYDITGYIASVGQPSQLGAKQESANAISLFANGRVFAEDILRESNSAKYYQNYLVGEIHADFLDSDGVDRATASREALKKDDPRYQAVLAKLMAALDAIGNQWDDWRTELGLDPKDPHNATVIRWLDTIVGVDDRRIATRLMTSIKNAVLHSDAVRNEKAKAVLYRGAIVGFQKLKLADELHRLHEIQDVLSPEFAAIFAGLDQVEESAYAEITRNRLAVIKKFGEITSNPKTLESVAQDYLFDNLWLLDPTWDRVTGKASLELTLTRYLKAKVKDVGGARLDISYRAGSGRHIVVELKRPRKPVPFSDLQSQVNRYRHAVIAYYQQQEPNKPVPALDIYVLVDKAPPGFDETSRRSLAEMNGRIMPYSQLMNDAQAIYQEYLDTATTIGPLEQLLREFD